MTHRTAYIEFQVAIVMRNWPADIRKLREWAVVPIRRPADCDPDDLRLRDEVVKEAVGKCDVTNEDLAEARETGRLLRPVGGCVIGWSAIQEEICEECGDPAPTLAEVDGERLCAKCEAGLYEEGR